MRVLTFSWEFPPHHHSGLGKACEGLAKALADRNYQVTVVLPRIYGEERVGKIRLISLENGRDLTDVLKKNEILPPELKKRHPLAKPAFAIQEARAAGLLQHRAADSHQYFGRNHSFGPECFEEAIRFGERAHILANHPFDVIHCHDWLTIGAGLKLKAMTGKPLIFHVHSLESERSGSSGNHLIDELERRGLNDATKVVTVSHHAKRHLVSEYGLPEEKIWVIHNGVSKKEGEATYRVKTEVKAEKTVLFAGPFVFRKGPEYFVDAAALVIPHFRNVKFVMSGSGEKLDAMLRKVNEWHLGDYFHFTGFLDGDALERVFLEADLYVMPSVDDPFGFQPLEAIVCDTPVIISKQSGIAETLRHALAVDFWDVKKMAEYILAILRYEPLARDLVQMAQRELHQLHWHASAEAFGKLLEQCQHR